MSNLPEKSKGTLPTAAEFAMMKEFGKMAVASGFLPTSIKTPEQAVIIIMKGRELGIPPMNAFSSIAVVQGKPTMSAELMLSMIYKNVKGAIVNFIQTDAQQCVIEAQRPGGRATQFTFSMEDAKRANLVGKGPWQTYPQAMLRARCISAMARAMFPDALSGIVYTPEELGAQIDDDGDVIDVPAGPDVPDDDIRPAALTMSQPAAADHSDHDLACLYCGSSLTYSVAKGKYFCSKYRDIPGQHVRAFPDKELPRYREEFLKAKERQMGLNVEVG